MYVNDNNVTYSDSFGPEHVPKEIKKFIGNKTMIANIFRLQGYDLIANIDRLQAFDSIMCGYFCTGFINFMFKR